MNKVLSFFKKIVVFFLISLPVMVIAQNPSNPGDNPDARPQDIPFDHRLRWILIAAAVILSVYILRRIIKKTSTTSSVEEK